MKIQKLLMTGYNVLKEEGIDSYMLDSQLLLGEVLNLDRMSIILNRDTEVDEGKTKEFLSLLELRRNKMPIKYILKNCEFMGIEFFVKEGVLIPRPDTEILVEEVMSEINKNGFKMVCDVCCGSGAIGLSIGKLIDDIKVLCCDISEFAEEVTLENIKRLKLHEKVNFIKSDLLDFAVEQGLSFDAIVSNPPYIREDVIPELMKDVKDYEPYIALCGGKDGLEFYRRITDQASKVLKPGGLLAYEIGHDQEIAVKQILLDSGFQDVICVQDLAGNPRVVKGVKYF